MKLNTEYKILFALIIAVSLYLIGMGFLATIEIIPLNLTKMGNPWGLLSILEGVCGILTVMVFVLLFKVSSIEKRLGI